MTKTKKRKKQQNVSKPEIKAKPLLSRQVEIGLLLTILLLTLGLRLIRIDSPLLDFHAHRQTQTASNTQGFAENTFNLFRPTFLLIDADGNAPGVTDMEFPIFQYILGMLGRVIGMNDLMGRLFAAFFGVGVAAYTYLLTRRLFGAVAALGAVAFYTINPVSVFFNRTFQPDTMALFFFIGGIYYMRLWFETNQRRDIYLYTAFTALSLLIKPPVVVIIVPWILYELITRKFWQKEQRTRLLQFVGSVAIIGAAAASWFVYSYLYIYKETGLTMIRGRGLNPPVRTTEYWFSSSLYIETLKRIWLILTPIGAILLGAALIPMSLRPKGRVMTALFIGYLLYFIIVAEYNLPHFYYQLPFIPIAAAIVGWLVGWAVDQMKGNETAMLVVPMALVVTFGGMSWMTLNTVNPWYNIDHAPFILDAAAKTKTITGPGARIYANNMFFGEFNYYTGSYKPYLKRIKGVEDIKNFITDYDPKTGNFSRNKSEGQAALEVGAEYLVWLKYEDWAGKSNLPPTSRLLLDEPNFSLWKLK